MRPVRRVLRQPNRKLLPAEIDQLVADYQAGVWLTELGMRHGLHRQTAQASSPAAPSEWSRHAVQDVPWQVRVAGRLYEASGLSLVQVAARFEVASNTLRRVLASAGYRIRPREYFGRQSR